MERVSALIQKLNSDPQFVLAQNVGTTHDLLDICLKRATVQGAQHVFQHVVPLEGKPVTNQKSSGEGYTLPVSFSALSLGEQRFARTDLVAVLRAQAGARSGPVWWLLLVPSESWWHLWLGHRRVCGPMPECETLSCFLKV